MKMIVSALLAGLVLSSCAPSTPQARIDRNPQKFAALGKREQSLVQQGKIAPGMSADAVMLAWGPPAQRFQGSRDAKETARWDYTSSHPVYLTDFYGVYGASHGPYGYGGYSGLGFGIGPEVAYVPYRVASVWFIDQRVDFWERVQ